MSQKPDQISTVPTNIITGFLGTGKTSTILQLLKNKPEQERWAVLVNEFGEIGIDGALFAGQFSEHQGVFIREVPGGCMCCTAGLPMRVALSQLLRQAKPDRLLIEPTGLGHPKEVLQTLNDVNFAGVISIQKILTLVDARQFADERYINHETFRQQISIADVIVANKQDLYSDNDKEAMKAYLKQQSLNSVTLVFTEQGKVDYSLLDGKKSTIPGQSIDTIKYATDDNSLNINQSIPDCGFVKALNNGEGFNSVGWRFSQQFQFDHNKLFTFLSGIDAERVKASFITDKGYYGFNLTRDALTEIPLDGFDESRIEIIARELNPSWDEGLFDCANTQVALNSILPE